MNSIELNEVTFKYKSTEVLRKLCLNVPNNSIYGYIGPNGSGKSTSINLMLGFLKPLSGEIFIMNEKSNYNTFHNIGVLFEDLSFYNKLTCYENLKIFLRLKRSTSLKEIDEVINIFNLLPYKNKRAKLLSSGYKQRLALAIAFLNKPKLIILDEPTNSLDATSIIELRNIIQTMNYKFGTTFFISSHLLSEVEKIATHVGFLLNGNLILEDKTTEILSNYNDQSEYFIKLHQPGEDIILHNAIKQIDSLTYKVITKKNEGLNEMLKIFYTGNYKISSIDKVDVTLEDIYKIFINTK